MNLLRYLPALLLLVSVSVQAEESDTPWYEVEIILFSQGNAAESLKSEHWPEEYVSAEMLSLDPASTAPRQAEAEVQAMAADSVATLPNGFERLPEEARQLGDAAQLISVNQDLELLWHGGWRQPGLERKQALPVAITIPMPEGPITEIEGTEVEAVTFRPPPLLAGELTLILSRYLHLQADMHYHIALEEVQAVLAPYAEEEEPASGLFGWGGASSDASSELAADSLMDEPLLTAGPIPSWQVFRMEESRRMRSRELHYLDHPLFGLVVRVIPYEPPAVGEALPPGALQLEQPEDTMPEQLTARSAQ